MDFLFTLVVSGVGAWLVYQRVLGRNHLAWMLRLCQNRLLVGYRTVVRGIGVGLYTYRPVLVPVRISTKNKRKQ